MCNCKKKEAGRITQLADKLRIAGILNKPRHGSVPTTEAPKMPPSYRRSSAIGNHLRMFYAKRKTRFSEARLFDQPINQSINPSINQSINQSTNQSINQSTKQLVKQSINQSINQTSSQASTQLIYQINQPINTLTNEQIIHSIKQSTDHPINQSINQSTI